MSSLATSSFTHDKQNILLQHDVAFGIVSLETEQQMGQFIISLTKMAMSLYIFSGPFDKNAWVLSNFVATESNFLLTVSRASDMILTSTLVGEQVAVLVLSPTFIPFACTANIFLVPDQYLPVNSNSKYIQLLFLMKL
jgi:hypothetical protein